VGGSGYGANKMSREGKRREEKRREEKRREEKRREEKRRQEKMCVLWTSEMEAALAKYVNLGWGYQNIKTTPLHGRI